MSVFDPSDIPLSEYPPWLERLVGRLQELDEEVVRLRDENARLREEISRLKGLKKVPRIRPSSLEKPKRSRDQRKRNDKVAVGRRTPEERTIFIDPEHIPEGSRFKGYKIYTVQELLIQPVKITFKSRVYVTPEGRIIRGQVPKEYSFGHFGPELVAHCLQLYHGGMMTGPNLLQYVNEQHGVDICSAQLNILLTENVGHFVDEMEAVRQAGISESPYLQADDTGARHQGQNGVCTCISSPLFCYFQSSTSKSRLQFLETLRGPHKDYVLNESAMFYAADHEVSNASMERLDDILDKRAEKRFRSKKTWEAFLKRQKIVGKKDLRLLTEAAVLASAIYHGLPEGLPIVSDAAPRYLIWESSALCWIHEERHYRKVIPDSDREREDVEQAISQIWKLYKRLKDYAKAPSSIERKELTELFDKAFNRRGATIRTDKLLKHTFSRKKGLLQVLDAPQVPLHNNDCERDIREYVKRRKISAGTRSRSGQRARDTFLSLKKTCSKLQVNFFAYLRDRTLGEGEIPFLPHRLLSLARAGP